MALAILGPAYVLAARTVARFDGDEISDFWSFLALIAALGSGIAMVQVGRGWARDR